MVSKMIETTEQIDFNKMGGLVPAIVQDAITKNVLMLGYMNTEAYKRTIETKKGDLLEPKPPMPMDKR